MAKNNVIDSLIMASRVNARVESNNAAKYSYFTIIMFALISLGLLIAFLFGTIVYKSINSTRGIAEDQRSSLAVISNAIRYGDKADAIKLGQGPEGDSLVIEETYASGIYEVRFYLYDGQIVQEYTKQGTAYDPSKATRIADSQVFDVDIQDGTVDIMTDQGNASVTLRAYDAGNAGGIDG